jgi:hypothetical protein
MNALSHMISGSLDLWFVLFLSIFSVAWLTKRFIHACHARSLRRLANDQVGATYMLPLVLTAPFYVLLIAMIVECTLLLTQKIGAVGAAYSAARAAAVWLPYDNAMPQDAPDYTPLENRQTMVRLAAARALFPYASGSNAHVGSESLPEIVKQTGKQQIEAFRTYANNSRFEDEYLARKFAYAFRGTKVTIKYLNPESGKEYGRQDVPAFNAKIRLTLHYEAAIHTMGVGRLLGQRSAVGSYFVHPTVTTVMLENEGVKASGSSIGSTKQGKLAKSLGIRYYDSRPSHGIAPLGPESNKPIKGVNDLTAGDRVLLHAGINRWLNPFDNFDAGEHLAMNRGVESRQMGEAVDLKMVQNLILNVHSGMQNNLGENLIEYIKEDGSRVAMTAAQLASYLRSNGFRGSSIELVACDSVEFAKDIAKLMQVKIIAYPQDNIRISLDGTVIDGFFGGEAEPVLIDADGSIISLESGNE